MEGSGDRLPATSTGKKSGGVYAYILDMPFLKYSTAFKIFINATTFIPSLKKYIVSTICQTLCQVLGIINKVKVPLMGQP